MVLVLVVMVGVWLLGAQMKVPHRQRWGMIGAIYGAVVLIHLVLPAGHALRRATGEELALWLLLGGFAVLVAAYRVGLAALRARAAPQPDPAPAQQGPFSETELNRYARHIVLRELGGLGQKRMKDARVLVVGAGGLGSPALLYLAGAGVGTIGVIDPDTVSVSNLQRQVIHTDARGGQPKVFSAQTAMLALNPHVTVRPYHRALTEDIAAELFADYDLILDGSDNFATRAMVNRAAVAAGIPLVSGAISQWEGQVSVFDPANGAPCYACVFPSEPADGLAPNCAQAGVAGPLPGVIGTMMALEAVKVIARAGEPLRGRMLLFDGLWSETRMVKLHRNPDCPVCKDT